jgi:tetratricopeptide (TPR) repeat protein
MYLRHASYYQRVLSTADDLYVNGGADLQRSHQLVDLEWANIQVGQAWAEAHADRDEEAANLCSAYPGEGISLLNQIGHPRERLRWLEAALIAARRLNVRDSEGTHLGNIGVAYLDLGEPRRAIEFLYQALEIARGIGDRQGESSDLANLGNAHADLGQLHRAVEFYHQALAIDREIGNRRGEGMDLTNLASAHFRLGDVKLSINLYRSASPSRAN